MYTKVSLKSIPGSLCPLSNPYTHPRPIGGPHPMPQDPLLGSGSVYLCEKIAETQGVDITSLPPVGDLLRGIVCGGVSMERG